MQALLDVVVPVFLVIGAGYFAVWKGFFSDGGVDALMKFTQNFAIPCLLFNALSSIDLDKGFDVPLLFSFYTGAASGFLLGLVLGRLLIGRPWPDAVAIGFCCMFSNSVLLGLPITELAYGADALVGNYAIVALHAPFCYFVGVTAMEIVRGAGMSPLGTSLHVGKAMFHNALIVGIVLGLLVNVFGIGVPGVLSDAIDLLSGAALPAALFGLGGVLVRYKPEGDLKAIALICIVSLLVHPVISWSIASATAIDRDAFRSVVLTAAMAPGANTYIFANMYGTAKRAAASSVLFGTALSVFTAWLWLLVLP